MKANKTIHILVIIIFIANLASCSNLSDRKESVDFRTNASNILVNTKSSGVLSFNVAIFSKKKIKSVTYIALEGTNLNNDDYEVKIIDNNLKSLNSYKYKSTFIKYLMVEITPKTDVKSCEFENLVLNVDGERRSVSFKTPIKHEFSEGANFTEALQIAVIPNEFGSGFINDNDQKASYIFNANEEVILNKVYFNDFLNIENARYAINEGDFKKIEFPLSIKKGQTFKIDFSFKSEMANNNSFVSTNLYFDYTTVSDDVEHFNSVVVIFDPIYPLIDNNKSTIDKLIDSIS